MCEPQRMHLAATLVPLLLPPPNLCAHCVQPDTGLKIKLDKSEDMIGTVSICHGLWTTPCGETVLPGRSAAVPALTAGQDSSSPLSYTDAHAYACGALPAGRYSPQVPGASWPPAPQPQAQTSLHLSNPADLQQTKTPSTFHLEPASMPGSCLEICEAPSRPCLPACQPVRAACKHTRSSISSHAVSRRSHTACTLFIACVVLTAPCLPMHRRHRLSRGKQPAWCASCAMGPVCWHWQCVLSLIGRPAEAWASG